MLQNIAPSLIAFLISLPLVFFNRKSGTGLTKGIAQSAIYQLGYVLLIFLPIAYSIFWIPETVMNWSGKLLATLFSIGFYLLVKKDLSESNFISSSTSEGSLNKIFIVGGITLVSMCLLTITFSNGKALDVEKLAYQATMPGIDEELWRGILLGLMLPLITDKKYKLGHPALWVTTIIFALGHSFYFQEWNAGFALDAFLLTGILGYILGWTILRSKSIIPAIILHNLINLSTNLLEMTVL